MKPHTSAAENRSSQQSVRDSVDDRRTPPDVFAPLNTKYTFTLDAAANHHNALAPKFYTSDTDGLLLTWGGERVWCNPPFSRLEAWVAKAWAEMRGDCELVVMLIPANRCEQPFWQEYVEPFRDAPARDGISLRSRFLRGRTQFIAPNGNALDSPPFGCVLLTWERAA